MPVIIMSVITSEFLSDLWAFLKHRKKLWLSAFILLRVARWVSCSHTAIEFSWVYLYAVLIYQTG